MLFGLSITDFSARALYSSYEPIYFLIFIASSQISEFLYFLNSSEQIYQALT